MTFQYANVPSKLKGFMEKIRTLGVPSKANQSWLASIGYKSSNDRSILNVLSFIGFVDSSSQPTDRWLEYRGSQHQQVLASAIKDGYSELFNIYPDAYKRDSSTLESFFSTKTTSGKQVISRLVRTFTTLCDMADFDGTESAPTHSTTRPSQAKSAVSQSVESQEVRESVSAPSNLSITGQDKPSLHIDIQIHISPDASADQIDQIFSSMAKHLYKN